LEDVRDNDLGALAREQLSRRRAHSRRRTGDNGNLVLQSHATSSARASLRLAKSLLWEQQRPAGTAYCPCALAASLSRAWASVAANCQHPSSRSHGRLKFPSAAPRRREPETQASGWSWSFSSSASSPVAADRAGPLAPAPPMSARSGRR